MVLYYKGLQITKVSISTILELALPLMAILIDIFIYKNFLSTSQYLAALVLMYAIYRVGKLGVSKSFTD